MLTIPTAFVLVTALLIITGGLVVVLLRGTESRHRAAVVHAFADLVRALLCPWRRPR